MYEKLKSWLANDTYFIVILLLLVGVSSFALGRLSVTQIPVPDTMVASLQQLPNLALENDINPVSDFPVVVSRSGTKYHLLNCPGAQQIKSENKIEFPSAEAAEAAGYGPAANCPGLFD
jgi:hypothetical protein